MNVRHSHLGRLVALTVVAAMPLFGLAGVASAAAPVGSAKWCANHPKLAKTTYKAICAAATSGGGGGGTGGTGGTPPNLVVSAAPDPVQEVGTSEANFIVQVEALAIFANQTVTISSQQLALDCSSVTWKSSAGGATAISAVIGTGNEPSGPVTLDNDGNATVEVQAENCAPGTNLIEADLTKAPYTTVSTELTLSPPAQSFTVAGGPTIVAAPNPEVETGDGGPGDAPSQVYVNFLVEENPVYAEGTVDVTSEQLTARCGLGTPLWSSTGGAAITSAGATVGFTGILDDDGNADITFEGLSCAPGPSLVTADLIGGTHDTFTTTFTISPPAVTDV